MEDMIKSNPHPKPETQRRHKTRSVRDYLQGVKSGLLKAQIRAAYRKRCGSD